MRKYTPMLVLGYLLLAFVVMSGNATEALAAKGQKPRMMLMPGIGDSLEINDPSNPGGPGAAGFNGALYDLKKEELIGSISTDIIHCTICTDVNDLLERVLTGYGFAVVDSVRGTFRVAEATIFDEHSATLIILPESPNTADYEVVVVAVAEGEITGGTKKFKNASGTTSLYLKIEINVDRMLPPKAVAGSFLFDFH